MSFELPPYPYDLLNTFREIAETHNGGIVDLSVGTPCDLPPPKVVKALSQSGDEHGYPKSLGSDLYLKACAQWMERRFAIEASASEGIAACVGTKEFVVSTPSYLRLKEPDKDTVLYPAVSYPSYAMGAELAGCRAIPVSLDSNWRMDLESIDSEDAARALMIWVNSPSNPTGAMEDLGEISNWGQEHEVPVFSDECYAEFTWDKAPETILNNTGSGLVAVHSLSKRSNLAGLRAGFYSGDEEIVHWLSELRKHAGMMLPGPVQAAAIHAFQDDSHVETQRNLYKERLLFLQACFEELGFNVSLPQGTFYLWIRVKDGSCWDVVEYLASKLGVLVTPGVFFGESCESYLRIAAVQEMSTLTLIKERINKL
ncbi:MAG: aminotransferase class I/II-fold pyridoxal phosphate-dependent enzyme [Actinomycetota bacterium]|nr:aminotransferase class I/II-fold pyridoxal phosphate-dependent enzyme [Actinomycetota bacterium]